MALCVREFEDGRICRERSPVVDTRPVRDASGRAKQARVVECPSCGLRHQSVYDDGPATNRYVPSENADRARRIAGPEPGTSGKTLSR